MGFFPRHASSRALGGLEAVSKPIITVALIDWGIRRGRMTMSDLLPDGLWLAVEPLLPKHPPSPKGGRQRKSDRACLEGILYVLQGGIPWRLLPPDIGVSCTTCWRRFHEWSQAGVWDKVHCKLLQGLADAGKLDIDQVIIDSASVRALF